MRQLPQSHYPPPPYPRPFSEMMPPMMPLGIPPIPTGFNPLPMGMTPQGMIPPPGSFPMVHMMLPTTLP